MKNVMFHFAFAHVSVALNSFLSLSVLGLAPLPEEPVIICLQVLGRPVFGELPKAFLVPQVSKCQPCPVSSAGQDRCYLESLIT